MSGGQLVVLDCAGREVKQYDLPSGSAILGSDPSCDIRIMLRSVRPHHATVLVHANQSVIRNVGSGETLLNGVSVSVAALRQDDVISLGGRELRWRYANPGPNHARRRPDSPALQSVRKSRGPRGGRGRKSEGAGPRVPHVAHRDSAPGAISARQVAIVQPQRRDTADHIESVSSPAISVVTNVRRRTVKNDSEMDSSVNKPVEEMNKSRSPKSSPINLQNTTKATLWIESRKSSPRKSLQEIPTRLVVTPKKTFSAKKSTPLRMAVLKKAQSAHKMRVTKIQAPLTIDHTKQAAIMLMTGHTPKQKTPGRKASLVVGKRPRGRPSKTISLRGSSGSDSSLRITGKTSPDQSPSVMEITDSDTGQSTARESYVSQQSSGRLSSGFQRSSTGSPIKSALKDPRKSTRKTESIKFDLSNLDEPSSPEDRNMRLRYSESPSPKPVQSRARDILRRTLGSGDNIASATPSPAPVQPSPSSPRLARGSLMLHRALRTTSPNHMETYSIVDLVSADSNSSLYDSASDTSLYKSPLRATRARSHLACSTPAPPKTARARSAMTSTSYETTGDDSQMTYYSEVGRRSKSLSTLDVSSNGTYNVSAKKKSKSPVNTAIGDAIGDVTFNISRRSRQSLVTPDISKENLTDNKTLSTAENTAATLNASTKSRRSRSTLTGDDNFENITLNSTKSRLQNRSQMGEANTSARSKSKSVSPKQDGTFTPKNVQSPEEAGTPVLSIQSLLESDHNATLPQQSRKSAISKVISKRRTIGGCLSISKKRGSVKSKSLRSLRSSKASNISPTASESTEEVSQDDGDTTPKSAVKLVQEAVKNKHSTAKKPKSKRSIIDNLNNSDIVKQLFNSPVKRKLSQSMIEFSRKQHLDEDIVSIKRATRKTIALGDTTPDNSLLEQSQAITPEMFVSPLSTPSNSPNVVGIKRLFAKGTPRNDLRNVGGIKKLLQTPRLRRSVRNDLTQVSGVKSVFARSPKNDLRRVSGVKSLFQSEKKKKSPKNDLTDVPNVRNLYKSNGPRNDLGNVSGVKRVMRRNSPRNDLSDVRGVRKLFHLEKQRDDLTNISGIEELFSESHQTSNVTDANSENSFNLLIGKPAVRSYGSKAKSFSLKTIEKPKHRKAQSLQASFSSISNNVEDWLENELRKRMHTADENSESTKKSLDKQSEQNMFDSMSNSNKSSSIKSRSMSRSKPILELSMSERKGRKSARNSTNITVEGNKSKINASNSSANKSKTHSEAPRKNMSRSRNEITTNNKSDFDQISTGNTTQLDVSINSPNKSKTRATPKNISSTQNRTPVGSNDISAQFNKSNTSVNKSQRYYKEVVHTKSMNKSKNKTSNINIDGDQKSKDNDTQFDASNNSLNKSKIDKEIIPRKSLNKSKNKTDINIEDNQMQSEGFNKSKTQKEATLRKSLNKTQNRIASNKSSIAENNVMSKDTPEMNTCSTTVETPRKSASKSKSKTNRSRELLKLATDTVEGNTPLLTTRIRNSTLTKTTSVVEEKKKSLSEMYSAHTLPIKKRSLVDRDTSGNRSEKSVLPMKKRLVVHSTPVKGKLNFTMNASEIGRVSPIATLVEETVNSDSDTAARNIEEPKNSPKRKLLQATSSNIVQEDNAGKEGTSPAPVRPTRQSKVQALQCLELSNVRKRKSTVVITKKTPVPSPRGSTNVSTAVTENTKAIREARGSNATRNQNVYQMDIYPELLVIDTIGQRTTHKAQSQKESPKRKSTRNTAEESLPKARKTRGQKVATEKVLTPKKLTRAKASEVGVVISKPSPRMKPSAIKQSAVTAASNEIEEPAKKTLPKTLKAQAETSNQMENNSKSKATNIKARTSKSQESARKTRNTRKDRIPENNTKQSDLEEQSNTKPKRGRKARIVKSDIEPEKSNIELEKQKRSTRGTVKQNTNENIKTKSKKVNLKETGKKEDLKTASNGSSSENTGRGRKRKIAVEESQPEVKKAKKNNANSENNQNIEKEPPETQPRTRGRQKKNVESSESTVTVKKMTTRRGGRVNETTEINNKIDSSKKAESKISTKATETIKKTVSFLNDKGNKGTNNETVEVGSVRGRKKQLESSEVKSKQNVTESKRATRRGKGDELEVKETKSDAEVKSTRGKKAKLLEKAEQKPTSRQKVAEAEKVRVKGTGRQKIIEPENTEVRTTRRQKAPESEQPLPRRKRKNNADGSSAIEAPQPSKTRKTSAASPKATRARSTKVEEAQKPAARTRRR